MLLADEFDSSGSRLFQSGDNVQQRSFAAPRRADDPEEFPVANIEAHPTERAHAALAGRELLGYTANNNFHLKDFGELTAKNPARQSRNQKKEEF
jgi:hypothetical protein